MENIAQNQVTEQEPVAQSESTSTDPKWYWNENIGGEGDTAPEWFKSSKYKTVADQAKAYVELEKKLGGFVGAPENYEINSELGISSDDPVLGAILPVLKQSGASNEFVQGLIGTFVEAQQSYAESRVASELKQLGDNADYRIKAVEDFAKQNVPFELMGAFKGMVSSADGVRVVEALMHRLTGAPVAPTGKSNESSMTAGKLREMLMAKNENGQLLSSIDPAYKQKVDKAYREFYGE